MSFTFLDYVAMDASTCKVLLVEDNEINRVVVRRLLGELNVRIEEADNGKAAVDFIREGRAYDLILMDKEMPIMDGHEATRQMRSLGVSTPIVALSGNSLQSDRDLFIQAGADDFLSKPLSRGKLAHILAKYGLNHGD
ncbi:two-component response regulator ORR41-like isoform X2 [Typha latifolia]|uniref:two-component response regulator ORR41-like isoform X2 n=1 Tax=Typha latifolia TaxID=4733 RepID=UPI003C2BC717